MLLVVKEEGGGGVVDEERCCWCLRCCCFRTTIPDGLFVLNSLDRIVVLSSSESDDKYVELVVSETTDFGCFEEEDKGGLYCDEEEDVLDFRGLVADLLFLEEED